MTEAGGCRGRSSSIGRLGLAVAVALAALAVATQARADSSEPVPITTGAGLDWGIKKSFREYIVGGIAQGSIDQGDGATRNPDGTFHFPVSSGSYDPVTETTVAEFGGFVEMEGHHGGLKLRISDPVVEIGPTGALLRAALLSRPLSGGDPVLFMDVLIATLDVAEVTPDVDSGAGTVRWDALPAGLGIEAVPAFAGHYGAGQPLDPVSFGYDGPGGKPDPPVETWSEEGVPVYANGPQRTLPDEDSGTLGIAGIFPDEESGVVHVAGRSSEGGVVIRAVDPVTLADRWSAFDPVITWFWDSEPEQTGRLAIDRAAKTLYVGSMLGEVIPVRWEEESYEFGTPLGTETPSFQQFIALDPSGQRLYRFGDDWLVRCSAPGRPGPRRPTSTPAPPRCGG